MIANLRWLYRNILYIASYDPPFPTHDCLITTGLWDAWGSLMRSSTGSGMIACVSLGFSSDWDTFLRSSTSSSWLKSLQTIIIHPIINAVNTIPVHVHVHWTAPMSSVFPCPPMIPPWTTCCSVGTTASSLLLSRIYKHIYDNKQVGL